MGKRRRYLLSVRTPLGVTARLTRDAWRKIVRFKHPSMQGRLAAVSEALSQPDSIRRSRRDAAVLLFYRRLGSGWVCAVVRMQDHEGSVATAYWTDSIKEGEVVWPT